MKALKLDKENILDILKSLLLTVAFSLVFVLIFAVVIKFVDLGDEIIMPVNEVLKSLSVLFGMLLGIKSPCKGALKGGLVGALFCVVSYLLFGIINADFSVDLMQLIDSAIMIVMGVVSGIIAVNVKEKR